MTKAGPSPSGSRRDPDGILRFTGPGKSRKKSTHGKMEHITESLIYIYIYIYIYNINYNMIYNYILN